MKTQNMMKSGLLAVAVAMLASVAARAQTPVAQTADLFLGLYEYNSGTGAVDGTQDYLLNLGLLSNYTITTTSSFTISGATSSLATDIATAFPSTSEVVWGLISAPSGSSVYVTNPNSTNWPSTLSFSTAYSDLGPVATTDSNEANNGAANTSGAIQSFSTVTGNNGTAWATEAVTGFNTFGDQNGVSGDHSISTDLNDTLSFDYLHHSAGLGAGSNSSTNLGTWSLNSSTGDLTFTGAAVPEPSTWASIVLGAAGLLTLGRRRRA
jgi:hypothetical protein